MTSGTWENNKVSWFTFYSSDWPPAVEAAFDFSGLDTDVASTFSTLGALNAIIPGVGEAITESVGGVISVLGAAAVGLASSSVGGLSAGLGAVFETQANSAFSGVFEAAQAAIANAVNAAESALLEGGADIAVEDAILIAAPEIAAALAALIPVAVAAAAAWFVGSLAAASISAAYQATVQYYNQPQPAPCPPLPHPGTQPTTHDPLVLDFAGTGINLTALNGSAAYFDYSGTGVRTQTGWITAGEGLLVMNPTDGATVTASNLLGAISGSGFADLAALDGNNDGIINASDAVYSQLRVWIDSSGSGLSNAGELFTLAQLGITSINLNAINTGQNDNGNTIVSTSTFSITNPTTGATSTNAIAEVNFQTDSQITSLPASSMPLTQDAINLPNLTGFGFMPDLNVAMSQDTSLEQMVHNLVFDSATMTSAQFDSAFQAMLYEWAGVTNVSTSAYGPNIDGQHMAVVYAYFGIDPTTNPQYEGFQPNGHNGPAVWEPAYQLILQYCEINFVSQIAQSLINYGVDSATAYTNPYTAFALLGYDPTMNTEVGDPSSIPSLIASMAPNDPTAAALYWNQIAGILPKLDTGSGTSGVDGYPQNAQGVSYAQLVLQSYVYQATETQLYQAAEAFNEVGVTVFDGDTDSISAIQGATQSIVYLGAGDNTIGMLTGDILIAKSDTTSIDLSTAIDIYGHNVDDIILEKAANSSDVNFSQQGSTLIATFTDGSTLDVQNFFNANEGGGANATIHFADGSSITNIQILNEVMADQVVPGDNTLQSFAAGGSIITGSGNDTLIENPFMVSTGGLPTWDTAGFGTTTFDAGAGDNLIVVNDSVYYSITPYGIDYGLSSLTSNPYKTTVINFNAGDGNDMVVTDQNIDYNLANLVNYEIPAATGSQDVINLEKEANSIAYNYEQNGVTNETVSFGAGISASDVTISAAGSSAASLATLYANNPDYADYVASANDSFYERATPGDTPWSITPWSLILTVDGAQNLTFTGGPDQLQGIEFTDGTVISAQQISQDYVTSEEEQNLPLIMSTELGNTLQGGASDQILVGLSGNDTLITGAGNDTLMAGFGINTYQVNASSGSVVIINDRTVVSYTAQGFPTVGLTEMDDTLALGAGIDPSQVTVTQAASLNPGVKGLTDIVLTIAGTGQTIRLTNENQDLDNYNVATQGNNGAAVGQIDFADGTVWTIADLLEQIGTAGVYQAATAQFPGYTPVVGTYGDDTLTSGAVPEVLAGGFDSDTYVVNPGDANVIIDDGLGGFNGPSHYVINGTPTGGDTNVLQFGAGVSAGDIVVSQTADGSDLVLTDTATGQIVTLADQLAAGSGSIIAEVEFADGTNWSAQQLFNASVANAISNGAGTIYGSPTVAALNVGTYSATLVANNVVLGATPETVDASGSALITFTTDNSDDAINYTPTAQGNSGLVLDLDNAWAQSSFAPFDLSVNVAYTANGQSYIVNFQNRYVDNNTITLTLNNLNDVEYEEQTPYSYLNYTRLLSNVPVTQQLAQAGDSVMTVTHDGLTVDSGGYAHTINSTGDDETFVYETGYGALTINEQDSAADPANMISLVDVYQGFPQVTAPSNYTIDAAGDLALNFGGGDVLTILHEYNPDGSISANGVQSIPGIDLTSLWTQDEVFTAVSGQTQLNGDGEGGIFDPAGNATEISDSGTAIDRVIYNKGYGALTINAVSQNYNDTIEFGAGITLASLSFSVDAAGDLVISAGGGDTITMIGGLGLVEPVSGSAYGINSFSFQDGSFAYAGYTQIFGSDGSVVNIDLSAAANLVMTGSSDPNVFYPSGLSHTLVGEGAADEIYYSGGPTAVGDGYTEDGALSINETSSSGTTAATLYITDFDVQLTGNTINSGGGGGGGPISNVVFAQAFTSDDSGYGSYGGGYGYGGGSNPPVIPDLGSVVGVTENASGDVAIYLGNGDTITLLGQLDDSGGGRGVAEIQINGAYGVNETWTNADIVAALAYEATTGIVPNYVSAAAIEITSATVATGTVAEQAGVAGSTSPDSASGIIDFTDSADVPSDTASVLSVSASGVINGAPTNATLLAMLSLGSVNEPANGVDGSVSWSLSAPSGTFGYLSAGEVLTLSYVVQIASGSGETVAQNVTVTVTGTNQAPAIATTSTSASGAITEQGNTAAAGSIDSASGSIGFTDANLDDTHSASIAGVTATGVTGGLPSTSTLLSFLSLGSLDEQSGTTPGNVGWTFAAADTAFSYLTPQQVLTLTYAVDIADNNGGFAAQNVTVTITGGAGTTRTYATSGTFSGVAYASYSNFYSAAGWRYLENYDNASGNVVASESFAANGGYAITLGGVLNQVKTVNSDTSYDIRYYTAGTFSGVGYASYDNAYNSAGFRNIETYSDASGNVLASESFTANGGYAITLGGLLSQVKTVNSDASSDIRYYTDGIFSGVVYGSYDNAYTAAGFRNLETYYDASSNVVASENFSTNGGYSITLGGLLSQVKNVNSDSSYDIRYYTSGTFSGVAYASYDNSYTSAGFRDLETYYDASGAVVASESFSTNGGYAITLGAVLSQVKTVNSDGSYDIRYYTGGAFSGVGYASYDNTYTSTGFRNMETYYGASGAVVAIESFSTNGGYAITLGSALSQVKTVNSNSSYDIRYYTSGTFSGVAYASYDNAYTAAGFRNLETYYDASSNVVASESFTTNGSYTITLGSTVSQAKAVNADGSYQFNYENVSGQIYTEAQYAYNSAGTKTALAETLSNGTDSTFLYSGGLTLGVDRGAETLSVGSDTFAFGQAVAGSTINLANAADTTLRFGLGDGSQSVSGFATSGSGLDALEFNTSIFADWAHLLGATKQVGSDLQITLDPSDTILLKNVALANFTSANAHFV